MWSYERGAPPCRLLRIAAALLLAGAVGGCFQPLYGERLLIAGSPGLRTALAGVQVEQISAPAGTAAARLAVEVRNALLFSLTGGGSSAPATHHLIINVSTSGQSIIVDPTTARPEFEITSVDAQYRLMEAGTNKQVMDGSATVRVSYDIPGQQQRFAMLRGQRDAQSRAARVVAEQIRNRLASYFAAGT
jgi:LPS-assembly lipoprotein